MFCTNWLIVYNELYAQSSQFKVWFVALSDSPGTTLQD